MSPPESEAFPDAEGSQAYKQHYVCYIFKRQTLITGFNRFKIKSQNTDYLFLNCNFVIKHFKKKKE